MSGRMVEILLGEHGRVFLLLQELGDRVLVFLSAANNTQRKNRAIYARHELEDRVSCILEQGDDLLQ